MATLPNVYGQRPTLQDRGSVVRMPDQSRTAAALGRVAAQIGDAGDELQKQQDVQAVSAARRKLDEWERAAIFDPEKGAVNRRGQDAANVPKELQESFDKTAGEVFGELGNDRQRRAFQDMADGRRAQVLDWGSKHALKERESFQEGEYQADVKSFQDRAALFPDKAATELKLMGERTVGYLRGRGRSTEEINQVMREQADKAHIGVVASLLNSDQDEAAKQYYDTNKVNMSADVSARVGEEIKNRGYLLQAQRNADDLVSRGVPEKQAIEETRKKFQGKAEEAAVQQVRTRFSEAEAARVMQAKEVSNSAWSVLMEKGAMTAIPAQTMAALRTLAPEEERQMRDWLEAKADKAARQAKEKFVPDNELYINLREMARQEPEKFISLDVNRVEPKLSDSQVNTLLALKDGIGKRDAKAMESDRVVREAIHAMDGQIRAIGIDTTPKEGSAQAKKTYAQFKTALTDALDQATATKKAPLTDQEARAISARMLQEGIQQGSGIFGMFQTKRRGYEIATDPALSGKTFITKAYADIPANVRADLVKEVRARMPASGDAYTKAIRGDSLTPEQEQAVERAYQRGVEQGVFK